MDEGENAGARGFTLLEMLVVLVITTVLIALGSGLHRDSAGLRVNAASTDLASDLRALRESAISLHVTASLTLKPGAYAIWPGGETRRLAPAVSIELTPQDEGLFGPQEPIMRCFADGSCTGGTFTVRDGNALAWVRVRWLDGDVVANGA